MVGNPPEYPRHSEMAGFSFRGFEPEPPTMPTTFLGYTGLWWGPNVGPPGFTSKFWTTRWSLSSRLNDKLVDSSASGCSRLPINLSTMSNNEVLPRYRGASSGPEGSIVVVTPFIWEHGSLGAVSA